MKKYVRLQEVMAEPMNLKEYEKKTGQNPLKDNIGESDYPGYMVMNSVGAGRWMKKEVFEGQFFEHQTTKDRMEFEGAELSERINKLEEFLKDAEKPSKLNDTMLTLLQMQYNSMLGYALALGKRIELMEK